MLQEQNTPPTRCAECGNDEIVEAHCNTCGGSRNHRLIARTKRRREEDTNFGTLVGTLVWDTTAEMLRCLGCEDSKLRITEWFSESADEESIFYFPPVIARESPRWISKLPQKVGSVMREVYAALAADSRTLAAIGVRTITDMVAVDKVGDKPTFKAKLGDLQDGGWLSSQNREVLEAVVDVGSAAAHRGHRPTTEKLNYAMDIVENLLESIYVLAPVAEPLKESVPPRNRTGAADRTRPSHNRVPGSDPRT